MIKMQNVYRAGASLVLAGVMTLSAVAYAESTSPAVVAAPSTTSVTAPKVNVANEVLESNEYQIGILDLLEIKVLQDANLSRSARVDARGNISMPLIGVVHVAGLSAYEAEQLIAAKLEADYLQNPQVSVFIKEFTSQRVTVQGVVKKAGLYDFQGQATLLQAISMGGGLDAKADERAVKVIRQLPGNKSETFVYDLLDIRKNNAPNPVLKGGDVVVVEEAEPITVEGAVLKAGMFYLSGNTTLMQVISQAGGLHDLADPSSIKVFSSQKNNKNAALEYDLEKIREGKTPDPVLHAGDVVVVDRSTGKSLVDNVTRTLRGFIGFGNPWGAR
jgi:polysaccharide export outer membrane protein